MTAADPWTGLFISFEGVDGSGKSTQLRRLAHRLAARGREVVTTREPGGSDGAEAIRKLLLEGATDKWSPLTEALLMYAARADHLERTIGPALKRGAIVLCDRFADSTLAYQGFAGELGVDRVTALHELVVAERGPDLTFILDLPVDDGLKRADARGGEQRFEAKGRAFQQRVRDAFLQIAGEEPGRCVVIDARGDEDAVEARIHTALVARLPHLLQS